MRGNYPTPNSLFIHNLVESLIHVKNLCLSVVLVWGGGGILRGVACRLIVPILRVLRNHSTLANGRDTMLQ